MKKVMALAAGFLVACAPAGTAFAGEPSGSAWGNCKHSASGGKTVLEASRLKNGAGLGGFTRGASCTVVEEAEQVVEVPDSSQPVLPPLAETFS